MLLVSASIYRRHVKALWSFPWLLVSMVDTRVSQADREEMTEQYDQKGRCCLPGGFARKLKVRGKTCKDLCHVQVPNPWGGGSSFISRFPEFDKSLPARGGMHACMQISRTSGTILV